MPDSASADRIREIVHGPGRRPPGELFWGILRICLGLTFLWAFLDRMFGLGFATCRRAGGIDFLCGDAFIRGGSPTYEFFATADGHGARWFEWMAPASATAPNVWDWVFMTAVLLVGVALTAGVTDRLAGYGGAVILVLIYLAGSLWPANHPFLDEQIIGAVILVGVAMVGAGRFLGLGGWWRGLPIVERWPVLR